jgi:hypothetical protein
MAMMSYSLDADFTPIPYSPLSPTTDMVPEPSAHRFELISEEDAPRISATKPSHAKKRDAGHIPRPPNAFILFRSSFIKSESVPGHIEGNHSTLSKIIGTCFPPLRKNVVPLGPDHHHDLRLGIVWKTLPPAERQLWEKRAVQAQAEHRARYPDWRFRPGTNVDAIAKRKTKDKNKDRPPSRRKRNASTLDKDKALATASYGAGSPDSGGGPGGGAGSDGGGGARCKKARGGLIQERRCAQIAELLARGVKGVALTSAVQAWDKESGVSNVTDGVFVSEQNVGVSIGTRSDADADADGNSNRGRKRKMTTAETTETATKAPKTRSASSAQEARFTSCNVALTDMYRRATSAPLAPDHGAIAPASPTSTCTTVPTSVSPVPDFYPPPLSPASSVSYGSEVSFPDSDNMSVSAFAPSSPPTATPFSHPFLLDFSFPFLSAYIYHLFNFIAGSSHVRSRAFLATGQPLQCQLGQQRHRRSWFGQKPVSRHPVGKHRFCCAVASSGTRVQRGVPATFLFELFDALRLGRRRHRESRQRCC